MQTPAIMKEIVIGSTGNANEIACKKLATMRNAPQINVALVLSFCLCSK